MNINLLEIPEQIGLDSIRVYWHNLSFGKGYITITCYGCAWTCYFGATGEDTIEDFFLRADIPYLVNKLGFTEFLKQSKKHENYLMKIIDAIKVALEKQK